MRNTQRLDKILSNLGYGTRKDIKIAVKNGAVTVDGKLVTDSGMHVEPETNVIIINGEVLNYRKFIYIMMNKPEGVISASFDNRTRTVIDLLTDEYRCFDLFPTGRLDIDTEGLLLLTNDGQLAHDLLSPKKHVPKKYYAFIDGEVTNEDIDKFKEGVILDDGYKTLPAELTIIRAGNYSEIELIIHEGKFHQVKRMFEAVNKKVNYLQRIQMGTLKLDESLEKGEFRELTDEEVRLLKRDEGENTIEEAKYR